MRSFGYGFMDNTSGFEISFKLTAYSRNSLLGRARRRLLNTLLVAGLGIVLATLLGFVVHRAAVAELDRLASTAAYVGSSQRPCCCGFFYLALLPTLPPAKQAISVGGSVDLQSRPLCAQAPLGQGAWAIPLGLAAGILAAVLFSRWARTPARATGKRPPDLLLGAAAVVGFRARLLRRRNAGVAGVPWLQGFNFRGGLAIQPELVALVLALTIYTATYIAEIVRSGIEGVSEEAVRGRLGARPRAGRGCGSSVHPAGDADHRAAADQRQYLQPHQEFLSLATATFAYPDLVAVFAGTALAQAGREIEILGLTAAIYPDTLNLLTSLAMNLYNRRTQLRER
ncbi:MAG: amino acid ABC transporter permease [Alphaproteobacteria bacterium]